MFITTPLARVAMIILFFGCSNNQETKKEALKEESSSFTNIEIHLHPAFNNSSIIKIDRVLKVVYYKVNTPIAGIKESPSAFTCSLDSFEKNTPVESFYSQNFLDSIRIKPDNRAHDGLTIFTVVNRENISDTIMSGNIYPAILVENVVSQIDYISKSTSDKSLIYYIKDLKSYFHPK